MKLYDSSLKMNIWLSSAALCLLLLTCMGAFCDAYAQGNVIERKDLNIDQDQYRDIAADLRCPTCTGLSVLDSDASFSVQIKNEVKEQMVAGKDKDAILKFFTERYGPWILRAPPTTGINLWAWIVPIAILVLGPVILWLLVWRRKKVQIGTAEVSRPMEDILTEMNQRLNILREKHSLPTKTLEG